ncbi:alpha/beta hydrolase [Francisella sp. 19X1-34]|uniref:alpha/beta hydrolase n=1 Tax=Francisella sp. 19X1-34 TaxID=3087177 RepID=UPI002E32982A|nr:alpha/beta hydrolase [Francisella sp. 19X1-34]MED7788258.1 alpha/beta hydrolase [Francisella sp. 19X1-34]
MKTDKILILVHGFIKNSKDMRSLESFFRQHYDDIISIDLPTTFVGVDVAVAKLCQVIQNIPQTKSFTFLAHSMGGIIVCKTIDKLQLESVDKCVFIATPFKGSKIADFGDKIPFYSRILKPNKELMATNEYLEVCNKVSAKFPVGLIAGNKHSKLNLLANLCLNKDHDGLVEVESALAINSSDRVILNKNHGEIHHDPETLNKVESFLKTGKF